MTIAITDVHPNFKLQDKELLCQTGWINGEPAKATSGEDPFPVYDPANDSVWAYQESMGVDETKAAIAAADAAFPAWSKTPPRVRARLLLSLDTQIRAAREDLAILIVMETGKALVEAYAEVDYAGE